MPPHQVHALANRARYGQAAVLLLLCATPVAAQPAWHALLFAPLTPFTRDVTLAANAGGQAAAAWVEIDYATMQLAVAVARRPDPGGAWLPAERVSSTIATARTPQVAVTDDGEVVVLWLQPEPGRGQVRAASRAAGASAWTVLDDVAPSADSRPLAVTCGDTLTALWVSGGIVTARRRAAGTAWGPVVTVGAGGAVATSLVARTAPDCALTAAWLHGGDVVAARATAAGAWDSPTALSSPGESGSPPALVVDAAGVATVAWRSAVPGVQGIRAARRRPDGGAQASLIATSADTLSAPALAVDGAGHVMAAWTVRRSPPVFDVPHDVRAARYDAAAATWSPDAVVATIAPSNTPGAVTAIADAAGTVTIAWQWFLGGDLPVISTSRFDPFTRTWRQPVGLGSGDVPTLVGLPGGSVLAAWLSYPQAGAPTTPSSALWRVALGPPSLSLAAAYELSADLLVTPPVAEPGDEPQAYEVSVDDGVSWTPAAVLDGRLRVGLLPLANDAPTRFHVRAINRVGPGPASSALEVARTTQPAPPTRLRVVGRTAGAVTIGWDDDSGVALSAFVLEGGLAPGQTLASLPPITPSARQVTVALAPGTYYVRLRAQRSSLQSAPSNELRVTVGPGAPAAPLRLRALADGARVQLSWTANLDGGPVQAHRLLVSGALQASVALPPGEAVSVDGVPSGTYRLQLTALNGEGESAPSNAVVVSVPGRCPGPPLTPAHLTATAAGTAIRVTWDAPPVGPAVAGYELLVEGDLTATVPLGGREVTATAAGRYTLRVRALNGCGLGPPTAPVTVTAR